MSARDGFIADAVTDRDLVRMVRSGDGPALGHLLARHRGEMLAVALSLLGRPGDAEDAVQDAMLVAVRRIGDLRDPGAVGPWLKMIVRNRCRMRLRAPQSVTVADLDAIESRLRDADDPADLLEDHLVRGWVWHAVEQLSPPLRMVTLLRYFTDVSSYQQISQVCGVPVGTVAG